MSQGVAQSHSTQSTVNIFVPFHCGTAAQETWSTTDDKNQTEMIVVTSLKPGSSFKICVGERE